MKGHQETEASQGRGILAWFAGNTVAANLLMALFIVGGLLLAPRIKKEVFPEVSTDTVVVSVAYPGASPTEVETGVIQAVEEAVRGIDQVKEVTAIATEGGAQVTVELVTDADVDTAYNDIKAGIDRITSFPDEIERPEVSIGLRRREVISVVLYGNVAEASLRTMAERMRDDLLQFEEITVVETAGLRPPEITVELSQQAMRRYGLTPAQVSQAIGQASVELPAGAVRTERGEVLLRVDERRERSGEFEDIVVLTEPDGTQVRLLDLGEVVEGFRETDRAAYFAGKRAAMLEVYRVGDQSPLEISARVREYLVEKRDELPAGLGMAVWDDNSEAYRDRIDLLLRNAAMGLILVLVVLGLFLEIRLAFWVTLGIPISFLGGMLAMPPMDVSLNMISLFGFILTLGIVVDDAIVVGEAVYKQRRDGLGPKEAAIAGAREVGSPVVFSVLTTIIAFTPLLFVPGIMGKFFRNIPLIVIPILLVSLVESLLILPAHLSHEFWLFRALGWLLRPLRGLLAAQQRFSEMVEGFIRKVYEPVVRATLRWRYLTLAFAIGLLIAAGGVLGGGLVRTTFFPKVEGDVVHTTVVMPYGTPFARTREVAERLERSATQVLERHGGQAILRGMFTDVGRGGSHQARISVELVSSEERPITTRAFAQAWREATGEVAGAEQVSFDFNIGPGRGKPINIELSHRDVEVLEAAAARLAEGLQEYAGVLDVDDGVSLGKEQLSLKLRPEARTLGVTQVDLARQLRGAFFGSEAVRQQRGRDEVRVYVRRPLEERQSEYDVESLLIRTPQGGEVPLSQAAEIVRGRSYTTITRVDGRRVVNVAADVNEKVVEPGEVSRTALGQLVPKLQADYPGLRARLAGQQQDRAESFGALRQGFLFALLAMFGLMAAAFKSYLQPIIVMAAIPFGMVGALTGHLVLGYDLSLISIMGIVALSGVVVNDSLVLVAAVNDFRKEGMTLREAVVAGGTRRFRPILLTSLTTFFGLAPMILETSVQARFLVPMAVSLGFGVLFVTFIALILVPNLYIVLEDVRDLVLWVIDRDHTPPWGRPGITPEGERRIEAILASDPTAPTEGGSEA